MQPHRYGRLLLVVVAVLALGVAGRFLAAPALGQAPRAIEYRYIIYTGSYMRDEQLLNTLGREGWEIAAATHQGFVMKR